MNTKEALPAWMVEKTARIIKEFAKNLSANEKIEIEKPFYEILFCACNQIMGEAYAFPGTGKILPDDLLQTISKAPGGGTLTQFERISIIILDSDAIQAANALNLSNRPEDMEEFTALKFASLSMLLGGNRV